MLIVGALVSSRYGRRGLGRYGLAGAATVGALVVPFFLTSPPDMWHQTVVTQLSRPPSTLEIGTRVNMLSAFWNAPLFDDLIPWSAWAVLWTAVISLAVLPLVRAVRRRALPRDWDDEMWWAIIALSHSSVVWLARIFYDHYAAWMIAPLALTTGAAVSRLAGARARSTLALVAVASLALIAIPQFATRAAMPDTSAARGWAMQLDCVWGTSDALLAVDAIQRNIAGRCDVDEDLYGVGLTLADEGETSDREADNVRLGDRIRTQLEQADGAIVSISSDHRPFSAATAKWFDDNFIRVGRMGDLGLWERQP